MRDQCPNCNCIDLIRYSSLNMKQCPDCKTCIPWDLAPGQLPLVGSSRQRLTRLTDSSILRTSTTDKE